MTIQYLVLCTYPVFHIFSFFTYNLFNSRYLFLILKIQLVEDDVLSIDGVSLWDQRSFYRFQGLIRISSFQIYKSVDTEARTTYYSWKHAVIFLNFPFISYTRTSPNCFLWDPLYNYYGNFFLKTFNQFMWRNVIRLFSPFSYP